jgi:predicted nucleic acid-binding protein
MVVLDTNIIIDHLRRLRGPSWLEKIAKNFPKENLAISVITIQELYEGKSTREKEKEKMLLATITPLKILSYTYEIAELAGKIARDSQRPLELADAAIAATAIINDALLATLNKKDFAAIPRLKLLELSDLG